MVKKEKGNYIFPNMMAKMMKGISQRTQYEASLMSIAFILAGMIIFTVYLIGFTESSAFLKIMLGLNMAAGFIFLSSMLVTTFQQYQSYLAVMGIIEEEWIVKEKENAVENAEKVDAQIENVLKGGNERNAQEEKI